MLNLTPILGLLLTSSALVSVSAQTEKKLNTTTGWGPGNYGGVSSALFDVLLDKWHEYLDKPSARGSVPLPIPDFTKSFTEAAVTDSNADSDWSWTIDLAEGLPVKGVDNVRPSQPQRA